MEQNQETPSALERRIDIAVSLADIEKEVDDRLKRIARTVKMAGFRPGKVPMKIVAQTHGGQARGEAVGAAVEKAFGDKVRAENLRVAGYPQIQPKEAATEGTLEFTAVFEVYPEVVVGDLAGQKIERPVLSVGEAEVDQTIDVLRKQRTTFTAVDRAAAEGDRVVIDFTGRKDGEVFDGGQAQDFPFVIGAGSMLKEFEGAVAGLKAGDSKTFDMTFPEDYHAQHLAGQAVQFEVTLKAVEEAVLPTVDGDFAKALGVADGDVSKLREEVKANLEREVKRRIQSRVKEQVMEALLAATPIEVPKALVQAESEQLANSARRDLEMRGLKTKDIPVEPAWFADQAVRRVKLGLIMAELVKANELHAKPEQVRALVEEMAQSYEDPSELMRWYYSEPERLAQAEAVVIEDNVVVWVSSKADTTDKDVAFDELMGNNAA
ncbi:trigger factor [Thauera aromatica]|uniref:Trigger factor n=1 Tax=Thauera aromatica K172 TaxID=44139 RepID=A0A2R4BQJ1_THAAR|nr:trigger factor [Thauera aromatica]AVR89550.1 Cell division trigger factor [Thauera aromatica K172]